VREHIRLPSLVLVSPEIRVGDRLPIGTSMRNACSSSRTDQSAGKRRAVTAPTRVIAELSGFLALIQFLVRPERYQTVRGVSIRAVPRVPQHRASVRIDYWGGPMHNNQAAGYITADNGIRKRRATNGVHMRKADKPLLRPLAREEKRSWSNPNHNNAGAGFHVDNPYVRAVLLPRHERAIVVEQKLLGPGLGGGCTN
jgi:hypothetical protein